MFEDLKAFYQGWKTKGNFPRVHPDTVRPYTDAVIAYLEKSDDMENLRSRLCSEPDDGPPFMASWKVLPFTFAHFAVSGLNLNRADDDVVEFTNETLQAVLARMFDQEQQVRFGDYVITEVECAAAERLPVLAGFTPASLEIPVPDRRVNFAALGRFLYSYRTWCVHERVRKLIRIYQSEQEIIVALSIDLGSVFVHTSTFTPTSDKKNAASEFICRELIQFFQVCGKR